MFNLILNTFIDNVDFAKSYMTDMEFIDYIDCYDNIIESIVIDYDLSDSEIGSVNGDLLYIECDKYLKETYNG